MTRMSKKNLLAGFGVFATLVTQSLKAQATQIACQRSIAGRYSVTLGEWSRPIGTNGPYHAIPPEITLDTASAAGTGGRVSPDIKYPFPSHFPGVPRWTLSHDTIQVVWSNGFQPTILNLVQKDANTLQGEAVVRSDANEYGNNPPHAEVTARRIACFPA